MCVLYGVCMVQIVCLNVLDLLELGVSYCNILYSIQIICRYLKSIVYFTIYGIRRVSTLGKSEIISDQQ